MVGSTEDRTEGNTVGELVGVLRMTPSSSVVVAVGVIDGEAVGIAVTVSAR